MFCKTINEVLKTRIYTLNNYEKEPSNSFLQFSLT